MAHTAGRRSYHLEDDDAGRPPENLDVFDFELTAAEMDRRHELEAPLWYRLNSDPGAITRFRSAIGPSVPKRIRNAIP